MSVSGYWVEGKGEPGQEDYVRPVCPDGFVPQFWGVVIIDTQSRPMYECVERDTEEYQKRWWNATTTN